VAEGAGQVADGAVLEWADARRTPRFAPFQGRTQEGALGRRFWLRLFEVLFSRSEPAEFAASFEEAGLDEAAINRIRVEITEGSSALFLVAATNDRRGIVDALGGPSRYVRLIHSNLPPDQEAQLRAVFTKP
jgi:uncharacterized membrane protein